MVQRVIFVVTTTRSAKMVGSSETLVWQTRRMDEAFAKEYLHNDLRQVREIMLWKLDGLSEYDIRRPLTSTGTNLLGWSNI